MNGRSGIDFRFVVAPLQILTGIAMSPAVHNRFPWYTHLFGGRQAARSLHFLGLCAFCAFIVVHVSMLIVHGFPHEVSYMVYGWDVGHPMLAVLIALGALAVIGIVHVWATDWSLRRPRQAQQRLGAVIDPVRRAAFQPVTGRLHHDPADVSAYFWVNGRPPKDEAWEKLAHDQFAEWALEVNGLVETPLRLSLADLRAMPRQSQVTLHCCIQGWTALAKWGGVPLQEVMARCRPLPTARYAVFHTYDDKWEKPGHGPFYITLDMELARHPLTLLADEMNDQPLPVTHGAPLRLRVENQLGFKMVKWLRAIEFVESYEDIGEGQGGWREDVQYYGTDAGI